MNFKFNKVAQMKRKMLTLGIKARSTKRKACRGGSDDAFWDWCEAEEAFVCSCKAYENAKVELDAAMRRATRRQRAS